MRRRWESAEQLGALPGLPAEIDVEGFGPVRGTIVSVGEGSVVIDVGSASKAALLAAASAAQLVVEAPGVRVESAVRPVGASNGGAIRLALRTA